MSFPIKIKFTEKLDIFRISISVLFITSVYTATVGYDTLFYIGGFNFTVIEINFSLLTILLLKRIKKDKFIWDLLSLFIVVLLFLQLNSVIRGLFVDQFQSIVSLRQYATFIISVSSICLFLNRDEAFILIKNSIIYSAIALSFLVLLRVVISPEFLRISAVESEGRPIQSSGAFVISVGLVILISDFLENKRRSVAIYISILAAAILFSRQGTAIACLLLGVSVVFTFSVGFLRQARLVTGLLIFTILFVIYLMEPVFFSLDYWLALAPEALSETLGNRGGTLQTRQIIWDSVFRLYPNLDIWSQFFGVPGGFKPDVLIRHQDWGFSYWVVGYHSMYVSLLIFFGAIGVFCFIFIIFISVVSLVVRRDDGRSLVPGKWLAIAIVLMCATFSYSYDLKAEAGAILAFGAAAARPRGGTVQNKVGSAGSY